MADSLQNSDTRTDQQWAKQLRRKVGRQILRGTADAIVADALAAAIEKKQLSRVTYLLTVPLPSLFSRHPKLPDAETAFSDAWAGLGDSAREKARYNLPHLYNRHRSTPLGTAVLADSLPAAEQLLARGAQAFHASASSPTGYDGPLGAAIFLGKTEFMSLLMAQPLVTQELQTAPAFRNHLLLTALGTDCAATLKHLAQCDPELMEKGRVYGGRKAEEFTLGEGIFAYREKLKLQRAFEESQKPRISKYGPPIKAPMQKVSL